MPKLNRAKPPVRSTFLGFRATPDELRELDELAKELGLRGKTDLLRAAFDYFVEHNREAKAAVQRIAARPKTPETEPS